MSLKTASKQLASTKTFAGSLTGSGGGGVTITSINITDNSWNN
jgi:mevalonate kinase